MFVLLILSQISLADSLFAHGTYCEARIEYLREFFFYPELYRNEEKRINYALASVYVDTLKGVRELIALTADIPEMNIGSKVRVARQYITLGYTERARALLCDTDAERLYGYTLLLDQNLAAARDFFEQKGDSTLARDIDTFMKAPKKSLRTATILSLVCPGTGEMYAGNIQLGIKDMVLNAGSIFLLYNALRQKKYVDAVLVFNFLFHRFYVGSLYNAQKTVLETNERGYDQWHDHMRSTYFVDIDSL